MSKATDLADALDQSPHVLGTVRHTSASELRRLDRVNAQLLEALRDMYEGWKYIRSTHGDLYGVGWDRCDEKATAAIQATKEQA